VTIQPIAWECECGGIVPIENIVCSACGKLRPYRNLDARPVAAEGVSLPWTWKGGYPQVITGPDATLIAEVYENPDLPARIAPLICEAVNKFFGWDGDTTYDEGIR
jgi:hypothetical protein